jgi:hypothetical protein
LLLRVEVPTMLKLLKILTRINLHEKNLPFLP